MVAAVDRIKEKLHPSHEDAPHGHEFQGTVHLQYRRRSEDRYEAMNGFSQDVQDALAKAGIEVDDLNVPFVRDMDKESDDAPKQYTTVLVALEVASPSESTAYCVANEALGEAMAASDLDGYADSLAKQIASNNETAHEYQQEADGRRTRGYTGSAERLADYAESHRAAAATVTASLEVVNKLRAEEGQYTQGRITNYAVVGYDQGERMGDVIPSQAVPSGN